MSILFHNKKNELIVTCECGCEESAHIKIEEDDELYLFLTYMNGKFYNCSDSIWETVKRKCKKIWCIIRNKDYYYSDIIMNKEDFKKFKEYINQF